MTAYAAVPNLYHEYDLSPGDSCQELGILLAGKDARAEAGGLGPESSERKRLGTVYAVLSSPENRQRYDAVVTSGETITWRQLEYLGNFGGWPPAEVSFYAERGGHQQQPQFQQSGQKQSHGAQPQPSPYAQPFNPFQVNYAAAPANGAPMNVVPADIDSGVPDEVAQRPSAGARMGMTLVDWILGSLLASFPFVQAVDTFTAPVWDFVGPSSTFFVVLAAYYVVCEVLIGATPGKLIAGYEVRDRDSKKKLTVMQSLKRNWFRVATLIPYIGVPLSMISSVVTLTTISPGNQLIGSHDDLANAEVAKRRRQ